MSAGARETRWAVRLSVLMYRRMLVAYPQAFRRRYGTYMVQVFRDCCREAAHADGAVGLGRYWLIALGDLIVSAFAERRREEIHMSRTAWIRLGSLAAIVGGASVALFQYPNIAPLLTSLSNPQGLVQPEPFVYYSREAWAATPVTWLLFILALVGLRAHGAGHLGTLGQIGTTLGIVSAALIGVGDAVVAAEPLSQGIACVPPTCTFYDPRHITSLGRMAVFAGAALFLGGMILYGVAALRRHALTKGWGNALPLLLGVLGLLSAVVVSFKSLFFYRFGVGVIVGQILALPGQNWDANQALGVPKPVPAGHFVGIENTMTVSDMVLIIIASFLFALAWIVLGRLMWPDKQEELVTQTGQVEPAAG